MDDILVKVIELAILAIVAVVGRYAIPALKAKIGAEKFDQLYTWAKIFVSAAEQIFNEKGQGERKRDTVTLLIVQKAAELGIQITEDQVRAILEAALAELKKDGVIVDE